LSGGDKETHESSQPHESLRTREHIERVDKAGAPDEHVSECDVTPVVVVPHKGDKVGTSYVIKLKLSN